MKRLLCGLVLALLGLTLAPAIAGAAQEDSLTGSGKSIGFHVRVSAKGNAVDAKGQIHFTDPRFERRVDVDCIFAASNRAVASGPVDPPVFFPRDPTPFIRVHLAVADNGSPGQPPPDEHLLVFSSVGEPAADCLFAHIFSLFPLIPLEQGNYVVNDGAP